MRVVVQLHSVRERAQGGEFGSTLLESFTIVTGCSGLKHICGERSHGVLVGA